MKQIKRIYKRLQEECFDAYLSEDETKVFFSYVEEGSEGCVRYLKNRRKYLLTSADGFQSMLLDTEEQVFEVIFFVTHCM